MFVRRSSLRRRMPAPGSRPRFRGCLALPLSCRKCPAAARSYSIWTPGTTQRTTCAAWMPSQPREMPEAVVRERPAGFDDGVVSLTSASLQFYMPGRTRVIPYCHIDGGGIISIFSLCPATRRASPILNPPTHNSAQIIVSFLNGTDAWQSVGTAAENDPFLSVDGGLILAAHAADDSSLSINKSATANSQKLRRPPTTWPSPIRFPPGRSR